MLSRILISIVCLVLVAALLQGGVARASEPVFARGGVSVGVSAGVAIIQMDQINRFLQIRNMSEGTRFDDFGTGWDIEIDVRYAVTDKLFLGLQGGRMWDRTADPISGEVLDTSGNPFLLIAGVSTQPDEGIVFRFLGGIGAMLNGRLENNLGTRLKGTGFAAQLGGELELRLFPAAGLTLQGVARTAQITDPEDAATGGTGLDIDLSGASVLLGIRGYFGGGQEE